MATSMKEKPSQKHLLDICSKNKICVFNFAKLKSNLYVHDTAINTKKPGLNTLMPTTTPI
jgi:hypothetical protein